LATFLG